MISLKNTFLGDEGDSVNVARCELVICIRESMACEQINNKNGMFNCHIKFHMMIQHQINRN